MSSYKKQKAQKVYQLSAIMNPNSIFVYENEKAFSALKIMQEREKPITILSVLDRKSDVVGMLIMHDLFKEGL